MSYIPSLEERVRRKVERLEKITEELYTPSEEFNLEEISHLISSELALRDQELLEKIEGMKAQTKMQIPDKSGILMKAIDKKDMSTILWHYQHTLADIHNQCLTDVSEVVKKNI